MRRLDERSIPFSDYLDAKFALDERSLNEQVRLTLNAQLRGRVRLSCLDVGSGTGAMVRRLLRLSSVPELLITVLDSDREVLNTARRRIAAELQQLRLTVDENGSALRGESVGRSVIVDFVTCRVSEFSPPAFRYDLITAHSFMDLVPIAETLEGFEQWLTPHGLLYSTLNYDGGTFMFPAFGDRDLEAAIFSAYDDSMDGRRVDGLATGGSRAGQRLMAGLAERQWEVVAYGTSDWNMTPVSGQYLDRDRFCIQAMLEFIRTEMDGTALDPQAVSRWSAARSEQLAAGTLGLIVHQLDVLASKPA